MRKILTAILIVMFGVANAQVTQTIRGRVVDSESKFPLLGANVVLVSDTTNFIGATADIEGYYRLEKVSLGRHRLRITFLGYDPQMADVVVTAGKEVVANVELQESVQKLKEFEVVATQNRGEAINEMAIISARQFSVEETDRYAGSRGDPARMASNFAGCQGADDSRNDIVVRGNSPLGVLYRYEGIDIPNPNHFSVAGSQGGPVSILNNKVLSNSDFFTGAFPAEYGNSTAAVFDIKMRNGNNEQHEFTGQFGFLGTELTAEGPISKEKRSSYLANYRYSTLALFGFMGLNIGTTALPKYQDAAFKLNFPLKGNANFSVFGIGGDSDIDIMISEQKPEDVELYGQNDRDQFFGTTMGVVGMNYMKSFNESTFFRATLAQSYEAQHTQHVFIYRQSDSLGVPVLSNGEFVNDSLVDVLFYDFEIMRSSLHLSLNKKMGSKHVLKFGSTADYYNFDFKDSTYLLLSYKWLNRWDHKGTAYQLQPYIQWKWRMNEKLTLNAGLHSQYFSNGSLSPVEPRAGLKWAPNAKQSFSLGFGMHSQLQPLYTYYYHQFDRNGNKVLHNQNMDFTRSNHYVMGYDRQLGKNARIKAEVYYQQLYNIPVTIEPSSFSLVNQGSGFSRFFPDSLQNTGTGENYGVELTIEKFFAKQFFFMLTGAYYNSSYTGSDGITRDTDFNGNYMGNLLASKEFKVGEKSNLALGVKVTYAGNKRYGPVDTLRSQSEGEIIYVDSARNSFQFDPYFRADIKVNYRINSKKVTHEIGLDLVNITGQQNVLGLSYAPDPNDPDAPPVREEYQLGFLPLFYYKIDF